MIYGYIRVSTDRQTVENQRLVISDYIYKFYQNQQITWFDESISSRVDYHYRSLGTLIDQLNYGDTLIVTEISRLGRDILEIAEIIKRIKDKGVKCFAIKENYELCDNIVSNCILFAFSLSAQIERDLISERTKMGLARAKAEGKQIGRQKGQKPGVYKLDKYRDLILGMWEEGYSILEISWECECKWETVRNWLLRNNIELQLKSYRKEEKTFISKKVMNFKVIDILIK